MSCTSEKADKELDTLYRAKGELITIIEVATTNLRGINERLAQLLPPPATETPAPVSTAFHVQP